MGANPCAASVGEAQERQSTNASQSHAVLIDPQNPPFPGTENAPGYRNYRFHFVAVLKGSVIGLPMALLAMMAA